MEPPNTASQNTITFSNLNVHVQDNNVVVTPKTGSPFTLSTDELMLVLTGTMPAGLSGKLSPAECEEFLKFVNHKMQRLSPLKWFTEGKKPKFVPYRCAKDYLLVYPHVITEYSGLMHQFTDEYWLRDAEGTIASNIEKAGTGMIKPRQIREAVESLRNLTRIIDPDKLNLSMEEIMPMPPHNIPISNGILNLLDKTIQPFSPAFYYTEKLPRHYIPGAVPEVFLQFLGKVFLGDPEADLKITQIFEIIAWTLMPNYNLQGAAILYGQGGEGKSIIHSIIADVIVHTTSISLTELEEDKFKRAELYGSWANLVSESSSNIVISEWFKRLTDGTVITAERKNQHPFQFSSHAKLILDVNELPVEEGQLRAFYRRVALIIDFLNMLEDVLSPKEIDDFVKKLKDPDELDRIFSHVVDHYYGPLTTRMKFTGHLSLADAEKKWTERSNPALTYVQLKHTNGEIFTDVEDVKTMLQDDTGSLSRYITRDKGDGTEYLTMVKTDVINAARKWAAELGLPAKTIDGGTLGKALMSLGYPNISVNKKLNKTTVVRAWRDIYIDVSDGTSSGPIAGRETPPLPPKTSSNTGENESSSGGRFQCSVSFSKNKIIEEDWEKTRYSNSKTLDNTEENPVAVDSGHPLPDRYSTSGAYDSESSKDIRHSSVQSEIHSITEEAGKLIIDKLLAMGYHVDPGSGPSIDQKYYKIGILGHRSIPADKREKLEYIMEKEHFTLFNTGVFGVLWYTRPLANAQGEDPQ